MKFMETPLSGCFVIELDKIADSRGFFARAWSRDAFEAHGLCSDFRQSNISLSVEPSTLRGLHFQYPPYQEDKLVRCTRGALYDVALDLRPDSPTFGDWYAIELTEENHRMLYIPKGFAHGFQTLVPNSEIFYLVTTPYAPQAEGGIRWNDTAFQIQWPAVDGERILSDKDKHWPLYNNLILQKLGQPLTEVVTT